MLDVKQVIKDAEAKMQGSVSHLEDTFDHIRAGRATVKLLDGIKCECYGTMMEVSQCANCSTPDAKSILIQPWDKAMLKVIEKAIIDSPLGIMPENNGEYIRIGLPPMTEDRRRDLSKKAKAETENAKVAIRNIRRDLIELLKKDVKNGLPEDVEKDAEATLQKAHDKYIKLVDELYKDKDAEIMAV
ncbi:MAG: ribosome recycling factor [Bacteroidales bacterium]|nr:ribosome recycling factor [Candidatus Liminaster caballi]